MRKIAIGGAGKIQSDTPTTRLRGRILSTSGNLTSLLVKSPRPLAKHCNGGLDIDAREGAMRAVRTDIENWSDRNIENILEKPVRSQHHSIALKRIDAQSAV